MKCDKFVNAIATIILLQAAMVYPTLAQSQQRPQPKAPTEDTDTIKVDTTLVTIPVSVLDHSGKFVPNLTKRNFRIYEDNIEQQIADFDSIEVPFNVVLLIDTSRSTTFKMQDIQDAAINFIDQLRPSDRVMIVSFDEDIYIDSEFTNNRARLRQAIYGTRTGRSTRLYDAVDLVVTERLKSVNGRKAIVLFTDGVDTASMLAGAEETIARVEESGVLVYPIQYNTEEQMIDPYGRGRWGRRPPVFGPSPFPRGGGRFPRYGDPAASSQFPRGGRREDYGLAARYLKDLADHSGARLYNGDSLDRLSRAFSLIAEELRSQYAISYYPTNTVKDGGYRRIRVRVDQPNLVVRSRDGYRASEDSKDNQQEDRILRPRIKG